MSVYFQNPLITLRLGDVRAELRALPANSVHCVVTSPPYWGLRDYGVAPSVWGGEPDCLHDWKASALPNTKIGRDGNTDDKGPKTKTDRPAAGSSCMCGAWLGCLGLEPTPEEYVEHLVEVFAELWRVLRPDGTAWLNLGDSFAGSWGNYGAREGRQRPQNEESLDRAGYETSFRPPSSYRHATIKPKDLVGIPWRVAFALQAAGWYVRRDVIWDKPNPMPESVGGWRWERHYLNDDDELDPEGETWRDAAAAKDGPVETAVNHVSGGNTGFAAQKKERVACPGCAACTPNDGLVFRRGSWRPTTAHEYIFFLAKSESYFGDAEAVREPIKASSLLRVAQNNGHPIFNTDRERDFPGQAQTLDIAAMVPEAGRNLRSVWQIATRSFRGAHFATFPPALAERCIAASTSGAGVCPTCGAPWAPVIMGRVEAEGRRSGNKRLEREGDIGARARGGSNVPWSPTSPDLDGFRPSCGCGAGLLPDDLETIASPIGQRNAADDSLEKGRAGMGRERGPAEGVSLMTRYEQRRYALQLRAAALAWREAMETQAGGAQTFAHYLRTDRTGARAVPRDLLEHWISLGWIERVTVPTSTPPAPVPAKVLDPFNGAGTTGLVAVRMGRTYTGIDVKEDYLAMSRDRIVGDAPLFHFFGEDAGELGDGGGLDRE